MTELPGHRLGQGPLTLSRVVRDAAAMFRQSHRRVAGIALVLFALPALLAPLAERTIEGADGQLSFLPVSFVVVAVAVSVVLRLIGPVAFSGFLDEAVAREYMHGEHRPMGDVLRSLPWLRLLVADLVVTAGTAIGLLLFIIPGLVYYACFGLVGPVLVHERLTVHRAFGRTLRLSRTALVPIVVLVLVPFTFEQVIHEILYRTVHDSGLGIQVLVEWLVAVLVGATVGLLEVALAVELMARNPEP